MSRLSHHGQCRHLLFLGVLVLFCVSSCISKEQITGADINPRGWTTDTPTVILFDNQDTLSTRTLAVVLRHQSQYLYNGITLQLTTTAPNGFSWQDTLFIPTTNVHLIPSLNYEVEQPYRGRVVFNQRGHYRFTFTPILPTPPIQRITGVGIHIY